MSKSIILNLTQHPATVNQIADGVHDVGNMERLRELLTVQVSGKGGFAELTPDGQWQFLTSRVEEIVTEFVIPELIRRAEQVTMFCTDVFCFTGHGAYNYVRDTMSPKFMIGGFAPLTEHLKRRLKALGCKPVVALSDRVSQETTAPDGTVQKTSRFLHCGFYEL